jgi:DnaJ-class molecular chaperone
MGVLVEWLDATVGESAARTLFQCVMWRRRFVKKRVNKTFITVEREGHFQSGSGNKNGPKKPCPHCKGTGFIKEAQVPLGQVPCAKCAGTGLVPSD